MSKIKTTGYGWANAYHENNLDDLPLGYIKKVEAFFREMKMTLAEPFEKRRLDKKYKEKQMTINISEIKDVLPLGEQPEGNLDALGKLEEARKGLFKNLDILQANIKKLKDENKKLTEALGLTTLALGKLATEEPLLLTKDMEIKNEC